MHNSTNALKATEFYILYKGKYYGMWIMSHYSCCKKKTQKIKNTKTKKWERLKKIVRFKKKETKEKKLFKQMHVMVKWVKESIEIFVYGRATHWNSCLQFEHSKYKSHIPFVVKFLYTKYSIWQNNCHQK